MNTALFFDTETTGLPDFKAPSDSPQQPYVTQIAAELCVEETGEVLSSINFLIKPEGWTVPEDVAALTGITTEKCEKYGFPIAAILPLFMNMWKQSTVRVAHNESFDMRIIRIAMMRDEAFKHHADAWKAGSRFCTCDASKMIVNLPPSPKMVQAGMNTPKAPKLTEAYLHFFGEELDGAHNAMVDVHGCKRVYYALRKTEEVAA